MKYNFQQLWLLGAEQREERVCSIKNNEGESVCGSAVYLRSQAVHMAEAGGEAVVVRDDDGGVERLEVEHNHRVAVEAGLRFHD